MSATDWGTTFETVAEDRLDLEDVSASGSERFSLVDGVATRRIETASAWGSATRQQFRDLPDVLEGDRIGIKVCRYRIADGSSTRRGRWYVPEEELERVDAVAFGVYTRSEGPLEEAFALIPSSYVRVAVGSWSDASHGSYARVTRPAWSLVFEPVVVDRVVAESER